MNSKTIKEQLKNEVKTILKSMDVDTSVIIEKPKEKSLGDYAIPCFIYSKELRKAPNQIAVEIKDKMNLDAYEKVEVVGGYINIFLHKKEVTASILKTVIEEKEEYGSIKLDSPKTVVLDYSSPNIAKPFGVGHLRSTVIGNAIKNICKKLGYQTVGINYLGDWGTQFGKIICAYNMWGDASMLESNTIEEIQRLYVKFHEAAKEDESLNDKGRECFKELENGNKEYTKLWETLRNASIKEFMKTYELLGMTDFDSYDGEAAANKKSAKAIDLVTEKGLLEEDDGAFIIRLERSSAPAIIKKNDGSSIYMTRDLAEVIDRKEKYDFDEILYVVGNEQSLHFVQLEEVVEKLGFDWSKQIKHINFGLLLQGGKKMSTRQGKSVKLHDVLEAAVDLARKYIEEKNPTLENIDEVSKYIGVGAVIFNDLKNYRCNDVEFDLEDILKFEGETGPYIQYTYARIQTMLEKTSFALEISDNFEVNEYVWSIISKISEFEEMLQNAKEGYDPSFVAKYALDLCREFNKFYANNRIVADNKEESTFRLQVAYITAIMIKESMRLLGINVPNKM